MDQQDERTRTEVRPTRPDRPRVAVVGGGAAGFFAALAVKEHWPLADVTILERTGKVLSKVRISGGGRCNVCHACFEIRKLAANYPRGEWFLRRSFKEFSTRDTIERFAAMGVRLKAEEDGRMFPITDDSATVVNALVHHVERAGVSLRLHGGVKAIERITREGFELKLESGEAFHANKLIITSGGHPKREGFHWLNAIGHRIVDPVPSLFTFNIPDVELRKLMGVVIPNARIRVIGTDRESSGPLLITHWGMSGPSILRLSAFGAREIHDREYHFAIQVNWMSGENENTVRSILHQEESAIGLKQVGNLGLFRIPKRAWNYLVRSAGIDPSARWREVKGKERNRLINKLTNDRYEVVGKTTFKEEFVTAGGVALDQVDPLTMQSKVVPGLYFAGEVLDIDGVTGGFNFQAAWTTGSIAGRLSGT